MALAGSALPLGYNLEHHRNQCGPHQGACMKDSVTALISSGPGHAPHMQISALAGRQPEPSCCRSTVSRHVRPSASVMLCCRRPRRHCTCSWLVTALGCRGLSTLLYWLISPATLGAACILLGFGLIVTAGQRARYQREAAHLKEEWMRYRKEMQAKVRASNGPHGISVSTSRSRSPAGRLRLMVQSKVTLAEPSACIWASEQLRCLQPVTCVSCVQAEGLVRQHVS